MAARVLGRTRLTTWDALPFALALTHGALLVTCPSIPVVAVGLWWNANTISHQFIHRPFFRTRTLNAGFSCLLSLLLGFPQSLWRARHLRHHIAMEGRRERTDLKPAPLDIGVVVALWAALLFLAPGFLLAVYLPGFVLGLGLCYLQGHYEHAQGTVSHYGWLYNLLFFNDGYHVEHHARPAASWRELPGHRASNSNASRWPAVLRWLEVVNLCSLERVVLRFSVLQRFVLWRHERAFRRLLVELPELSKIAIVGGGLFPRTALILRRLLPESKLVLIDQSESNLAVAREYLSSESEAEGRRQKAESRRQKAEGRNQKAEGRRQKAEGRRQETVSGRQKAEGRGPETESRKLPSAFCLLPSSPSDPRPGSQEFVNQCFEPETPCDCDLLVIPLAFVGDRQLLYEKPPAPALLVHDWIWRRRGSSAVVSWLLLKRLNLVKR